MENNQFSCPNSMYGSLSESMCMPYGQLHPQDVTSYTQHFHVTQSYPPSLPETTSTGVGSVAHSEFLAEITKSHTSHARQQRAENNARERVRVKKINKSFDNLAERLMRYAPYQEQQKMVRHNTHFFFNLESALTVNV